MKRLIILLALLISQPCLSASLRVLGDNEVCINTGETYNDWSTPIEACTNDDVYATSATQGHQQDYYGFTFNITESSIEVIGISLVVVAKHSLGVGQLLIDLSWDGGTSWTEQRDNVGNNFGLTEEVISYHIDASSGITDDWGRSWAVDEFSTDNFRVRIENNSIAGTMSIDYFLVKVAYWDLSTQTIIVKDRFTEAVGDTELSIHAMDTGAGWTEFENVGGAATIEAKEATDYAETGDGGLSDGSHYKVDTATSGADYSVLVNARPDNGDDVSYIFCRVQSGATPDLYAVELDGDTNAAQIYKRVSGSWTALGSTFGAGQNHMPYQFECNGSDITVYRNGVSVASASDSDITGAGRGGIGIGALRNAGDDMDNQFFNDFLVVEAVQVVEFPPSQDNNSFFILRRETLADVRRYLVDII